MDFDKNQTQFPSEKHKAIWYCGVLVMPEELSLSEKVKGLMDAKLVESCKQMRLFMLHSLSYMYENADNSNFDPYQYFGIWLNILGKPSVSFANKLKKLYGQVLADTGVEFKIDNNSVELTSTLYPKMFAAMKALQEYVRVKKERASMENSFQICDFRKICPGYKYDKSEKRLYMRELEDRIPLIVEAHDAKVRAQDFAAYLRDKKINLKWTGIQNSYSETGQVHMGQGICYVGLGDVYSSGKKGGWLICVPLPNIEMYQDILIQERLQDFIRGNIYICTAKTQADACNGGEGSYGCHRGEDLNILGDTVKYACRLRKARCVAVYVHDPDDAAIDKVKTLLELEQKRGDNSAKHK